MEEFNALDESSDNSPLCVKHTPHGDYAAFALLQLPRFQRVDLTGAIDRRKENRLNS
jgi:hypothetical protein